MDNWIYGVIEQIRNFFTPSLPETNRKRRAVDDQIGSIFPSAKYRRLQPIMSRDLDSDFFLTPSSIRRSTIKSPPSRNIETIILDDDDDVLTTRRSDFYGRNKSRKGKFTSTPDGQNNRQHSNRNSISDDDEVSFVKEIKLPKMKQAEASKLGVNYISPFSSLKLQNGTGSQIRHLTGTSRRPVHNILPSSGGLDYSFRLEDKLEYKKLLEKVNNSDSMESIYKTPQGKIFGFDTSSRSSKILNMSLKNSSKERMSTKDTIQKVLDNFPTETVVLKDSDSESDVVLVEPPSPKPDIKVEPVNSLKKVIDTSKNAKEDWVQQLVDRHKTYIQKRQQEIDSIKVYSEKHSKINKEIQLQNLTDKVNRALQIKEQVLPVEEAEEELPELTAAQMKIVENAFRGDMNEVLAKKFNLNITRRDLRTLAGLNWLNDEVINFYMNLIIERSKQSPDRPKAFAFNTFFYPKLLKDGPQGLRRWTKRVDLFEHDMICIPIHLGMHWCMAIIDFRDKSIRYYDSMGSSNDRCLEALRHYLEAEHMDKKKTAFDTSDFTLENVKDIPQQMNGSDCGMFSCTFAEFLTRDAKITFSQEHMPYLRNKMVLEIITGELLCK
ncbi:unnamed protein product [Callosobruchus maculatus]|uniref:Ubiquitin-like protease family profile domain-containing protein n=1 Tax=Callosobruchus maculatus TaxID=64391 RepID=A0A653BEG7_CALMS|nr:unnamed protein product [Callosobruchus maculatus]